MADNGDIIAKYSKAGIVGVCLACIAALIITVKLFATFAGETVKGNEQAIRESIKTQQELVGAVQGLQVWLKENRKTITSVGSADPFGK